MNFFGLFIKEQKKTITLEEVTVSANGTTYYYNYTKEEKQNGKPIKLDKKQCERPD